MAIVLAPILLGVIAGWSCGGRFQELERVRFHAPGLVALALGVQLTLHRFPAGWRTTLLLASYAAIGAWIARNCAGRTRWLRAGLGLVAAGWAMNLAAMVPNGGMPVSESALAAVGVAPGYDVADGHLSKHVGTHGGLIDEVFGDSIPVAPLGAVISLGDIALAAGIALTLAAAMTGGGAPPLSRSPRRVPASR